MNATVLVSACVVRHGNEILLIKRSKPPYVGFWSMPGGKINYGEHPTAAALREVKEETGLICNKLEPRGVFSEVLRLPSGEEQHFIIFVFESTVLSGEVIASAEGELKWFSASRWEELKGEMIPSDWLVVKQLALDGKSRLELREVKLCEKLVGGKTCYELEKFAAP